MTAGILEDHQPSFHGVIGHRLDRSRRGSRPLVGRAVDRTFRSTMSIRSTSQAVVGTNSSLTASLDLSFSSRSWWTLEVILSTTPFSFLTFSPLCV